LVRNNAVRRVWLLFFFFLSGMSGLIYQIAWVRQASLTFGVSVYAYSTVLGAYMIGLALGSYVMGRRIDANVRPLRTYAILEVGIALLAVMSTYLLTSLNGLYAAFSHTVESGLGSLTMLRLTLSIVVLTPATFMIGATLPIMSRVYATRSGQVGRDVGRLYLFNTIGGALGCLFAGIYFIRFLGLRETIFLGATLNLLVALGTFLLARFTSRRRLDEEQLTPSDRVSGEAHSMPGRYVRVSPDVAVSGIGRRVLSYVVAAYAVSGFVALGYELVWARILYIHTAHAVYSFSLMLAVYLFGLAVGSATGTWWLRRRQATLIQFGILQLSIGLLAILIFFVFAWLPTLQADLLAEYTVPYELFIAFITLFPPTLLMGMLFPVVSSLYTRERPADVGLRIGTVNALNTLGAILGSLGVGFVLIPLLGLRNTSISLSMVNFALGVGALWLAARHRPRLRWVSLPVAGVAVAATLIVPPGVYLGSYAGAVDNLIFYKEGVETTVAVLEVPEENFKISFVNGRDEVPTDPTSMRAFRLLGHLPPLLRPEAQNALVLSFGNGIATGTMNTHGIPVIDAVDLSREMIEAAELYGEENYDVLNSDRLRLHVEDARNFLLQSDEQYDIITTDATHPANASSWALFTEEFYELVRSRLSEDGVFMQWLPIHGLEESDYRTIIRTVWHVFPNTTLWSTGGTHSYVVVTPKPLTSESLRLSLARASDNPIVIRDLGPPMSIAGYLAMTDMALARYVGFGPAATDNNAYFMPVR
jgi:spermidine synthase